MGDNSARTIGSGELVRTKSRGGTAPNEIKTAITIIDTNRGGSESLMDGALPVEPRSTSVAPGRVELTASVASQPVFSANLTNRCGVSIHNLSTVSYVRVAYSGTADNTNWIERIPPGYTWRMPAPVNTAAVSVYWESNDGGTAVGVEHRR